MPTLRAYWQAKDFGRCVECFARNPEREFARCGRCRDKRRKGKERAAATGLCISCQNAPARIGLTKCQSCNEVQSKYQMERYAKLKAAGLCVECGEIPSVPGRAMCELCRVDNVERVRALKRERVECQLCTRCGVDLPDDFYMTCAECRNLNAVRCLIYDSETREKGESDGQNQR